MRPPVALRKKKDYKGWERAEAGEGISLLEVTRELHDPFAKELMDPEVFREFF